MSSNYRRICLSHNPPLVFESDEFQQPIPHDFEHGDHPNCKVGQGRFSYPIIEAWLPIPFYDKNGNHAGKWYDVSWIREFPELARAIADGAL